MPSFHIVTFGCKVNQVDTAGMAQDLVARGWTAAPTGAVPELILVNTCTVTARADQQARQVIRRLAREHPGAAIWVTGCYAQRAPAEVAALPGVQAILGNQEKVRLAEIMSDYQRHLANDAATLAPPPTGAAGSPSLIGIADSPSPLRGEGWGGGENINLPPPSPLPPGEGEEVTAESTASNVGEPVRGLRHFVGSFPVAAPFHSWRVPALPGHTRAWLKIQDGCNHCCSYCIVPRVRGPRRSMAAAEVISTLQELAARGYQEVVLTGVDLGQYGRDQTPPLNLAALVRRLKKGVWPFRVRFSSLEPQEVTGELLMELASWRQFCPHFHLPLQSGAAPVLAAMGRPYGPRDFLDLVTEIHRHFPDAGLGLDLLVGFPGETASDFEATRTLVASLPATYLHVFPFSPRPGTAAARMTPTPVREIRERARVMRDLGRLKKTAFLEAQLGQVREVLVEGPAPPPGWLQGLSDNYLRVIFPGPPSLRNRRLMVQFRSLRGEVLAGEIAE